MPHTTDGDDDDDRRTGKPSSSLSEKTTKNDDNDDDEEATLTVGSLFLDTDYAEARYDVAGVAVRLLRLEAAATDHDLTGQVVWPVSILLAWFVASRSPGFFAGQTVVELGAGCGLPGFALAAALSSSSTEPSSRARVVVTDGSDVVVDLLRSAADKFAHPARVRRLAWGDRAEVEAVLDDVVEKDPRRKRRKVDVVLGADVVAWPNCVEPLLQTVAGLLLGDTTEPRAAAAANETTTGVFYCGFVCRAASTQRLFFETAAQYGFDVAEVPQDDLLPPPKDDDDDDDARGSPPWASKLPLRLLELRLARTTPLQRTFLSDDAAKFATMSVAC
mmetsp:Transcript_10812/g.43775  ORF Transcript_10812/g.43775 Transcript_10812/m.43775 type:complete len:332 (-) Transcript_10812:84-1079(-)